MIEREIRYCTTEGGVGLAYAVSGAGPVVLFPSAFISFSRLAGGALTGLDALAERFRVVRYDLRGMGLSDRTAMDYSLERRVADVLAIADCVGAERFSLVGESWAAPVALAVAARYPDRVDKLVVRDPFANGARFYAETSYGKVAMATNEITVEQWEFISQTIVARGAPDGASADELKRRGEAFRASWDPEGMLAFREGNRQIDIANELADVQAPTLVLQTSDERAIQRHVREVMARLPNARLVVGPGARWPIDETGLREIAVFLGAVIDETPVARTQAPAPTAMSVQGMTAILFTDIAESTALTERLGDSRFRELSRALDVGLRTAIRDAGGVTVEAKTLGDGVLATFGSAAQAIDGARRCLALSAASELGLHIGLHAGDVIREEGNVFGGAVNIAARICELSAPGEILVSDVVRGMARSSAGVVFEDRGEQEMKGVGEAVRVYVVRAEGG